MVKSNKVIHKISIFNPVLVAFMLILGMQSAQAVLLQIDSAVSRVQHKSSLYLPLCMINLAGELVCPQPEPITFSIAGNVELNVIPQYLEFDFGYPAVDRTLLRLKTSNLSSSATKLGFFLDGTYGVLGLMTGEMFKISDHPCFLFVGPGSCSGDIGGTRTSSSGSWDGNRLIWNGYQSSFGNAFTYSITATVASVTEPSTLSLFVLPLLLGAMVTGWRRSRLSELRRTSRACFASCRNRFYRALYSWPWRLMNG